MTSNTEHAIPFSGAAAREWIDDTKALAFPPYRAPDSDEAVLQAVRLLAHLALFLHHTASSDIEAAFASTDSDSTDEVAWRLPTACMDLGLLCRQLGERYRQFAVSESIQLRKHDAGGQHPEISHLEAAGIALGIADSYVSAADQLSAASETLSDIRSAVYRIRMDAAGEDGPK